MISHKRQGTVPVSDRRTINDPNTPRHNSLNSPRGASLEQRETTIVGDSGDKDQNLGRSQNVPLKQSLMNAQDFSRRESVRPLGDIYSDVNNMIQQRVSSAQLSAGTGLVESNGVLSVDTDLSHVSTVGTLTALDVSGNANFSGTVTMATAAVNGDDVTNKNYVDTSITTATTDMATRAYADSLVVQAGTGLTKTGNTMEVDPSAITSVGTLTGLTVSGPISTPFQFSVPADGDTINVDSSTPGLIINPGADIATLTVVLPGAPSNGQQFFIHSTHNITTFTATATFAAGNAAPTTLTAGVPLRWIYSNDLAAWLNL